MKFRFNFNLEVWMDGIEIEAKSEEEAIEQLYKMSVQEYFEEGYDRNSSISEIESEVIEYRQKVKAYDIEWDIEEDDYEDKEEYIKVINSLPEEVVVEIEINPELDNKYHLFEEDHIADEISYKVGRDVKDFKYIVLEEF